MSKIVFKNCIVPVDQEAEDVDFSDYLPNLIIKNIRKIPLNNNELVKLPERRALTDQ